MRRFTFTDPDTGEVLAAEKTTMDAHNQRASRRYKNGAHVQTFTYILGVTQWGFDRQKTWVVCRCNEDGKTWAYRMIERWPDEDCLWSGFPDPRSGLNSKEQVGHESVEKPTTRRKRT